MLERIRRSSDNRAWGFTLIELLVVMIIIGILAAIAIPVFLNQRAKGRDTSTEADVSTVGKEIATYFVDGNGTLTLTFAAGTPATVTLSDGTYNSGAIRLSSGTTLTSAPTAAAGFTPTPADNTWCVSLTNPAGKQATYKYSATGGLVTGYCP